MEKEDKPDYFFAKEKEEDDIKLTKVDDSASSKHSDVIEMKEKSARGQTEPVYEKIKEANATLKGISVYFKINIVFN